MAQTTTIHGDQLALFALTRRGSVDELFADAERHAANVEAERKEAERVLNEAVEAAELKRIRQRDQARAAAKGTETSRAALLSLDLTLLEQAVVDELAARGPGTAEEVGDRLQAFAPGLSCWGPQTMSGTFNRLLRKRRVERNDKRPGRSGRLAWVWELRPPGTLAG